MIGPCNAAYITADVSTNSWDAEEQSRDWVAAQCSARRRKRWNCQFERYSSKNAFCVHYSLLLASTGMRRQVL